MRPNKDIGGLADLRTMFNRLFEEIEFTTSAKSSMQVSPCTAVSSVTFWYVITAYMPANVLNIVIKLLNVMKI